MRTENKLDRSNIENIMDLTNTQQGMLYHYINDEDSFEYHEQLCVKLSGDVDIDLMKKALDIIVENNEMLRTIFRWKGIERPVQIALKKHEVDFNYIDVTNKIDKFKEIDNIKERDLNKRIDISKETLRVYLCKFEAQEYEMIVSNHHILYDGWSNGIILKELIEAYNALYKGNELKRLNKTKFSEFILYSKSTDKSKSKLYWEKYLEGYEAEKAILDNGEEKIYKKIIHSLSKDTSTKLIEFSKLHKVSLAALLYSIWGIILQKLSNKKDVVFGTIVSGRNVPIKNVDEVVGLFINTIPIRMKCNRDENLLEFIKTTDCTIKERVEFENTSLIDINNYCNLQQNENLFNTIVGVENYPIDMSLKNSNTITINNFSIDSRTSYDVTLEIRTLSGIELHLNYNNNVISDRKAQRLAGYFENLAETIISFSNTNLKDINIMSQDERNSIVYQFKNNYLIYPKDITLHELFEIQAQKAPENIAVSWENNKLTYRELNEKANKLARTLIRKGVKTDSIIGIMVHPSLEMIIGIMGILKAGGAYMPIEPDYPKERIEFMLNNSGIAILLTKAELKDKINAKIKVLMLDDDNIYEEDGANIGRTSTSSKLSYVIYTSGTTGFPKGVLIEHKNVINLAFGLAKDIYSRYEENLKVALIAPYVFDASVQQIFPSLIFGHTLFLVPKEVKRDGNLLLKYLNENQIDISDGTPVHINMLNNARGEANNKLSVKHFIIGGDVFGLKLAQNFYKKYNKDTINFTNVYGPTECCVDSTSYSFNRESLLKMTNMPIGKPMHNESVYILDEDLELLPIGAVGELYISGDGVGRGYLNNEELTKERFINNPYNVNEILYRTGDYARWTEDGNIEFLGRKDHQVKIRGFRIELDEIENKILSFKKNEFKNNNEKEKQVKQCSRCLLTSEYPNIHFNEDGVCNYCESYESYKEEAGKYFEDISGFNKIIEKSRSSKKGEYDCLLLFSGGKDSSYVLYRLVDMGLKVLAFTFDNGYISDTAFENIKRITTKLKVDSIICKNENMDKIFLDSLKNDCTVCTGCFKALTAISTKIAYEKGINLVVTGLSRGQIFDTKLHGLYEQGIFEIEEIEKRLLFFRKIYHLVEDKTAELLNVDLKEEKFFDETYFVDFFRYENMSSSEIKEYLKKKDEFWSLPGDTGFCSTNCLINDVGIYVHSNCKGYHNYAAPLSWDCRLGQLNREAGLLELEPSIDEEKVQVILDKIGYACAKEENRSIRKVVVLDREDENSNKYLCAYFVSDEKITVSELREYLSSQLPEYMIPSYFIRVDDIPVSINGKIDRNALIKLKDIVRDSKEYIAPRNEIEEKLQKIWHEILGIERISVNESFFELGGHSLSAMYLITKISKEFNVEVPLKEIFKSSTISKLGEYIETAEENPYLNIEKVEEREAYETSSAQKRMYVLQQFDRSSTAYNIPAIFELAGTINKEKIEETLKKLVSRHEALRTYFKASEGDIVQKLEKDWEFNVVLKKDEGNIDDAINKFIRPFNLEKAPMFRAELVENQKKTYLLIDMHHIISDGVSMSILIKEFTSLYNGEVLEPLKLQYKDFAAWQNRFLKSEEMKKQEEYWINIFSDEIPVLNLPVDFERSAVQSFEGDTISFEVDEKLTNGLKKIARETGTTMHMVLLSAFNILLSKYSGQEDIVVGTPIAGRPHDDLQGIMGMFVNTLALRNKPEGYKRYKDFLSEVKEDSLKAYENQSYQLEALIERLDIRRDTSRNPLFDVMFSMVDAAADEDIELGDVLLKQYNNKNNISKFDLTLSAKENDKKLGFNIEYCTKLFKKETIERLSSYFTRVLENIADNADIRLNEVNLLSEEERNQILFDFNDTKADYPKDKTIQELFEAQVEKTPDNIAVIFEDKKLTYRELNERANSLARVLRHKGVKADSIVGVMVERSLEMIVGIMGILKAGGAYLPIDPNYPKDRVGYMLKDSGSKILISSEILIDKIEWNGEGIYLSDKELFAGNTSNLEKINKPDDSIYVIYTSGTTGNPKGTIVKHHSFTNLMLWYCSEFNMDEKENVLLVASVSFDLAQKNIYAPLLVGGRLTLANKGIVNYEKVNRIIAEEKVTIINCAPSMFYPIAELNESTNYIGLKSLRYVFLGGEPINLKKLKTLVNSKEYSCQVVNTYGPTECTDITSFYRLKREDSAAPIGKPINNVKAYILDKDKNLVPVGVQGELYISGVGVSRGYLNKPELTEERFVDNPFEVGTKMYRTGDLVKWIQDGNIDFIGRVDNQIKIRGFRVELGEIENKLVQHIGVKEAVVIVKENWEKEKYLCAYIVSERDINELDLKPYLKETLPEYMIPSYFVQIEKMPLTGNGKIDKRALPEPNLEDNLNAYEAPRNELEENLAKLWSEVLGVERVGIDDNFFDLGGHSLKATMLMSKIHKELNKEVPLKELFKSPTIKELSMYLESAEENLYANIEKIEAKEYYEASSAQKRMYMLQQFDKDSTTYNIPAAFELEGKVDKNKIEETFRKLTERHEALRTYFQTYNYEIIQKLQSDYQFKLSNRCESGNIEEIINDFVRPFDLGKAPLFRVELVENGKKTYLLIDMHHIISDGVSMSILIKEFAEIYIGKTLEPLKLQYKDFSAWQNNFLKSEEMKSQEEYWIDEFSDEIPLLNMPTDHARPAMQSFEGDSVKFEVDAEITLKLNKLAKETGTTMHMILLSVFNILLSKYSGQEDIVVGTPIAGRPHADLQNIMGMFVNTLALRNRPEGDKKYIEFLKEVKENSLKAYENQSYQLEALVERLNVRRDTSRNPLFDVMFNYINLFDMYEKDLDGLIIKPYDMKIKSSKVDLLLTVVENLKTINLELTYSTNLYNRSTIETMKEDLINILEITAGDKEMNVDDIILECSERYFDDNSALNIDDNSALNILEEQFNI